MTDTLPIPETWVDAWSSPSVSELAKALAAAQGEFAPVEKNSDNPFFKSRYADLAAVVKAASPITARHGLAVTQIPGTSADGRTTLRTTLMHESGEWVTSVMTLYLAKPDPQSQGSALTYARRYAYAAILGIVTEEDDDGNAATAHANREEGRAPAPPRPAPRPTPRSAPPEWADGAGGSDGPPEDPTAATTRQLNMLRAILGKDLGITDNDDVHDVVSAYVGRQIVSLRDLTRAEASRAIDQAKAGAS